MLWRIALAALYALKIGLESAIRLFTARSLADVTLALTVVFRGLPSVASFLWTGNYPSRYGGHYDLKGKGEEKEVVYSRMQNGCPPTEVLRAHILSQMDVPETGELINRELISLHLAKCPFCVEEAEAIRRANPNPPDAPIIISL